MRLLLISIPPRPQVDPAISGAYFAESKLPPDAILDDSGFPDSWWYKYLDPEFTSVLTSMEVFSARVNLKYRAAAVNKAPEVEEITVDQASDPEVQLGGRRIAHWDEKIVKRAFMTALELPAQAFQITGVEWIRGPELKVVGGGWWAPRRKRRLMGEHDEFMLAGGATSGARATGEGRSGDGEEVKAAEEAGAVVSSGRIGRAGGAVGASGEVARPPASRNALETTSAGGRGTGGLAGGGHWSDIYCFRPASSI